jgi:twitching motility protein PilT
MTSSSIEDLLRELIESEGSDLHLKVGMPPIVRIHGELQHLDGAFLTDDDTAAFAVELLPPVKLEQLDETGDAEVARTIEGLGRFRVNVYSQRGARGLVLRRIITAIPTIEELHLPPVVAGLAEERRGLILLTGPAGTGKTTTIAAMIGHINRTRRCHVITLEDPIEVMHQDGLAAIDQREVGVDIPSYGAGLRFAVRQDPDVLFIGEIRDEETADAALKAAETGHLIISTMHTIDAAETLNRFVDLFPGPRQPQARGALAGSLRAVIAQRLIPQADGVGRVPAVEILIVNGRVADRIVDPSLPVSIPELIEDGGSYGMQSFDQSLVELVRRGVVDVEDAMAAATNRHDLSLALAGAQIG